MKRPREIQEESAQDSFLDVIANLVGVIIVLVMLVGAKATRDVMNAAGIKIPELSATSESQLTANSPDSSLQEKVKQARAVAHQSRQELEVVATRLVRMRQEAAELDTERVTLAMHRSVIEEDIARRRNELDAEKQREFDVQRRIAESQIKLDELTKQQMGLLAGPETVEELESVPTPLAREVDSTSIHLRVKNGLVSVVPFYELIDEAMLHVEGFRRRLQSQDEVSDTFGPINGYRVRFTVTRVEDRGAIYGPMAGQIQQVDYDPLFEMLPTSEDIGQDVELAVAPGGTLYTYLESRRRQSPAVVAWVYTDSFNDFRILKRLLWEMKFAVATRTMPLGRDIGASPHGTTIDAQ